MVLNPFSSQASLLLGLLSFGLTSLGALISRAESAPTATVKNGSYYGIYNPTYNQEQFLGIPFAQPPIGELRFANPVSLDETWEGSINATEYSPECYGYGSDQWVLGNIVSEDCLTLNVVRPGGIDATANLPVGVWIHGGGHYQGGGRDPRYNLSFIVQQSVEIDKPFIAVSMNYRLHAFGFLFGSAVQSAGVANLGYKDQRLALQWIQENIAAFGGDTSKVTIWGESAGGASVGAQLLAYGGRDDGLFRAAILQSGGPITSTRYVNASSWDKYYSNITQATNCSDAADTLACLRTIPIDDLSSVLNSSVTASVPAWGAQVDGDFLQESGTIQLLNSRFVKVPLLHGRNFDEGTAFAPRGINTTEQFLAEVMKAGPDNSTAMTIAALYPDIPAIGIPATLDGRPGPSEASLGVQWKRIASYIGDLRQHAPRRLIAQTWASNNLSSWSYNFNVLVNGIPASMGSTHFQEVAFVFDNTDGLGYDTAVAQPPFKGRPESYYELARVMSTMWVSFIVDGDPNKAEAVNTTWPQYTLGNPQNLIFDANDTRLAFTEPDQYRAKGIEYIIDRIASVYGR